MSKQSDRINDNNPYKHIRQKTNDEWILFWICEDSEFKNLMNEYIHHYESRAKVVRGRIKLILNQQEESQGNKLRLEIMEKFGLTENEFDYIQTGSHTQFSLDFPFEILDSDDANSVVISIPRNIKKKDYIQAWDEIHEIVRPENIFPDGTEVPQKRQKRNRAADDNQLIYAVYKARRAGLKFGEIFKLYQAGHLDGYFGRPTNNYSSEDSLERYYNKYKPDR